MLCVFFTWRLFATYNSTLSFLLTLCNFTRQYTPQSTLCLCPTFCPNKITQKQPTRFSFVQHNDSSTFLFCLLRCLCVFCVYVSFFFLSMLMPLPTSTTTTVHGQLPILCSLCVGGVCFFWFVVFVLSFVRGLLLLFTTLSAQLLQLQELISVTSPLHYFATIITHYAFHCRNYRLDARLQLQFTLPRERRTRALLHDGDLDYLVYEIAVVVIHAW